MGRPTKKDLSKSNFLKLLEKINAHSKEEPLERYSREWFFQRYVRRLMKITNHLDKPNQLESTVKGMTRFFLDLEKPTPVLSEQFDAIRAGYSVLKRAYQAPDLNAK